jgi:hypothetical protein
MGATRCPGRLGCLALRTAFAVAAFIEESLAVRGIVFSDSSV